MLKIDITLKNILKQNNLTQKELSEITGIREASISELFNKKRKSLNIDHLEKIINVLKITDIGDILQIKYKGENNDK